MINIKYADMKVGDVVHTITIPQFSNELWPKVSELLKEEFESHFPGKEVISSAYNGSLMQLMVTDKYKG